MCLVVVGMGGLNAVDVAQTCHLDLLIRRGVINSNQLMEYGRPLPMEALRVGIYIDDLVTSFVAPIRELRSTTGPDKELIDNARVAYRSVNLPQAEDKGFGFACVRQVPDLQGPGPAMFSMPDCTAVVA